MPSIPLLVCHVRTSSSDLRLLFSRLPPTSGCFCCLTFAILLSSTAQKDDLFMMVMLQLAGLHTHTQTHTNTHAHTYTHTRRGVAEAGLWLMGIVIKQTHVHIPSRPLNVFTSSFQLVSHSWCFSLPVKNDNIRRAEVCRLSGPRRRRLVFLPAALLRFTCSSVVMLWATTRRPRRKLSRIIYV